MSVFPTIRLNKIQLDILYLTSNGKATKEIAAELFRSHRTIETHKAAILVKFNAKSMTQACCDALRIGILDYDYKNQQ